MVLDNANVTLPEINTLERDVPDLTAGSVVYELYLSGVLNGVDEYGTFDGQHTVTRGQAAAMLARLVDPAQRRSCLWWMVWTSWRRTAPKHCIKGCGNSKTTCLRTGIRIFPPY